MSLKLVDGSEFLHIPKTGGSWVAKVLTEQGLVQSANGHKHADFNWNLWQPGRQIRRLSGSQMGLEALKLAAKRLCPATEGIRSDKCSAEEKVPFRFCFVRNPFSWYESWFNYMQGKEWRFWGLNASYENWHPNSALNGLGSDNFEEFVRNVIRLLPGYVTEFFYSYAKIGISYVGKNESLVEDLISVLNFLGLDFDETKLRESERENVSSKDRELRWSRELKDLVFISELPALIQYDYLTGFSNCHLQVELSAYGKHPALHSV